MSKLGLSITPGSRNGYGPFCTSKPAVVIAVDEGGALGEAWANSGGYTFTVFRDTTVFLEAPPEWNQTSDMIALARLYYPRLKAKWLLNPAEFYTITNEIGGGTGPEVEANYRKLVTYEREVMRLANLDGLRVCVLNCAGGSPGDINIWRDACLPFILEAGLAGNVYGRHVYGQGDLVGSDGKVIPGNPSRPLEESDILAAAGYRSGIILTETGIDGGYGFAGDRFVAQMKLYEQAIRGKANIIGMACWTAGDWNNANCQNALGALGTYNIANPTLRWTPTTPPTPPTLPKVVIVKKPAKAEITKAENDAAGTYAWDNYGRTTTHSIDDMIRMLSGGNQDSYAVLAYPGKPSQVEARAALQAGGYRWVEWPTSPTFAMTHWPTRYKTVNQRWGANREYYAQFGLPGHDGVDIKALLGTDILAVATGIVSSVYTNPTGHNYGIHVRIDHGDGWQTIYAHLERATVTQGQGVTGGTIIGKADSTGNSTGTHLHLGLKRLGYTYIDPVTGKSWPYNLFNPEPELMRLAPEAFPTTPTPVTIDLLPYIRGDGRLYEVQTVGGGQERFQSQSLNTVFWQTKGTNFEELAYDETYIWRGLDISPGPAPSYAERPGVLRYYTAKETGQQRARWCKRFMAVGETFTGPGHYVQFYYQDTCQPSGANSGAATNRTTLKAKHASKTWNGITVNDVIEMTNGTETWYFARGFGLVAWSSAWGSSAISEIHAPGTRPDNVKLTGCWS